MTRSNASALLVALVVLWVHAAYMLIDSIDTTFAHYDRVRTTVVSTLMIGPSDTLHCEGTAFIGERLVHFPLTVEDIAALKPGKAVTLDIRIGFLSNRLVSVRLSTVHSSQILGADCATLHCQ